MAGVQGIAKIPELRRRILFTFIMLALFRFGAYVPIPGINADVIKDIFGANTLFGFIDI